MASGSSHSRSVHDVKLLEAITIVLGDRNNPLRRGRNLAGLVSLLGAQGCSFVSCFTAGNARGTVMNRLLFGRENSCISRAALRVDYFLGLSYIQQRPVKADNFDLRDSLAVLQ
ncbi:hypothetical protein GcC1_112022, partial [Golovinomyces cichoracearum]